MNDFFRKAFKQNPVFILALGLCPVLAVSNAIDNAIGMGFAATFVLICSNIIVSLLRNVIPDKVRIPAFIIIIATFVTLAGMILEAYIPSVFKSLGIFVPLIVVNCIILGRAEAFASKNTVMKSIMDALAMGFGFFIALFAISFIREILGTGKIMLFGTQLISVPIEPMLAFILPPGALLTMGLLLALFNQMGFLSEKKLLKQNACAACPSNCGSDDKNEGDNNA